VENENDTNQLQMPVTIPLMIAYFIALYAYKAPDSSLALWGSLIPFTSPIVMLARIPFGVPGWQIILYGAQFSYSFQTVNEGGYVKGLPGVSEAIMKRDKDLVEI